jgi:hypothetical protein
MRIIIDIDGNEGTVLTGPEAQSGDPTRDDVTGDGGAGPAIGAIVGEGEGANVVVDSGPPPDWLLQAVAAAEAGGVIAGISAPDASEGDQDAGIGPSA